MAKFEVTEEGKKFNNPLKAIKEACKVCIGGGMTKVLACTDKECSLFAYRCGKNPFRAKRQVSDEFKAAASERFKKMWKDRKAAGSTKKATTKKVTTKKVATKKVARKK